MSRVVAIFCVVACGDSGPKMASFRPTTKATVMVQGWGEDAEGPRSNEVWRIDVDVPQGFRRDPDLDRDPHWSFGAKYDEPFLEVRLRRSFDRKQMSRCRMWGEPFRWVELPDGFMESCDRIPARRVMFANEIAIDCTFTNKGALPKERVAEAWKICESFRAHRCERVKGYQLDEEPFYPYVLANCDDGSKFDDRDFRRYVATFNENARKNAASK